MKEKEHKAASSRRTDPEKEAARLDSLVDAAKGGDIEAFSELYGLYGKKILNYIFRLTGSREEAEDLMQDTFVLAFRNLESLKENTKFQSWLFRIAQNSVFQKYRGKTPQIESIDIHDSNESGVSELPALSKGPEDRVLSEELERVVQKAINELPEKYRQVFVLSAIQRLSYQEISEIVGRSLASVKSDIHRARVEVRDKIKQYLGDNYGMSNLY
ncbi:MAG TPA: sigma-70 family RNA polymerase sigma factor [Acidobacteriota bacterium]|nr:sigma-70 family RNA polymerase sigma factor [Acidobacteriota bacterium]